MEKEKLEEEKRKIKEQEEAEERAGKEKEYEKKRNRLLKQLDILEEGHKSEFISDESYNQDKEKIKTELDKLNVLIK